MKSLSMGLGWGAALLAAGVGSAFAQQGSAPAPLQSEAALPQAAGPTPPSGIPVGPMTAYPGVDVRQGYDDNLFLAPNNRRSTWFTGVAPYLRLEAQTGLNKFGVGIAADIGRFHSNGADNYEDYSLFGNADLDFTSRARLGLRAEHRYGHDPRGSTNIATSASPDRYRNTSAEGLFSYGAQGAQGRIEVNAGYFDRNYITNRANTAGSDKSTLALGGTFLWRVAPKTELLVNGERRTINYDLSTSTLDSTEDRLYLGAKWEATAATTGIAKFGRLRKDFKNAGRNDFTGNSWDVGVRWSPRTYSTVDLSTSKQTNEAGGVGDLIYTSQYAANWNHAWTSRISSKVMGSYRNDDYRGPTSGGRDDKIYILGLGATYQFQRWLRFGVDYTYTNRDSNLAPNDYRRNQLMFTAGAAL